MTATAQRRTRTPVAGVESPARPVLAQVAEHGPRSAEVHDTAGQDAPGPAAEVRAAAAAARAVGVQVRCIHRWWLAGQAARTPHTTWTAGTAGAGGGRAALGAGAAGRWAADLLLDGVLPEEPSFPRGARVSVLVPVPVLTCAGTDGGESAGDGVPVLSGHGPISAEVARQLAAGAGAWHRVLTHPVTGAVLDHDRTVCAVPRDLRRLVELRDGTCRLPGCRRRSEAWDLDHTAAWARGGPTAEHNLAALCRHHHRVKHRHGHLGA